MRRFGVLIPAMGIGAFVGWTCFSILLLCLLTHHYIFHPFLFGFAYYALYAIVHTASKTKPHDPEVLGQRVLFLGFIALVYMYTFLQSINDSNRFERLYASACERGDLAGNDKAQAVCGALRTPEAVDESSDD